MIPTAAARPRAPQYHWTARNVCTQRPRNVAVWHPQAAMAEASEIILGGFRLRSDAKIVRWPDRYMDDRGRDFWGRLMALLPAESDSPQIRRRHRPIPVTFDEETGGVRGYVEWAGAF